MKKLLLLLLLFPFVALADNNGATTTDCVGTVYETTDWSLVQTDPCAFYVTAETLARQQQALSESKSEAQFQQQQLAWAAEQASSTPVQAPKPPVPVIQIVYVPVPQVTDSSTNLIPNTGTIATTTSPTDPNELVLEQLIVVLTQLLHQLEIEHGMIAS